MQTEKINTRDEMTFAKLDAWCWELSDHVKTIQTTPLCNFSSNKRKLNLLTAIKLLLVQKFRYICVYTGECKQTSALHSELVKIWQFQSENHVIMEIEWIKIASAQGHLNKRISRETLEKRRLREHLKGGCGQMGTGLFSQVTRDRTRGNSLRLDHGKFRLEIRK